MRDEQRRQVVAHLAEAQRAHAVRHALLALGAAVPGKVVVAAVVVALAVGGVALGAVRDLFVFLCVVVVVFVQG